jgi:hypothetical protein
LRLFRSSRRSGAEIVFEFDGERVHIAKGKVSRRVASDLAEVLKRGGVVRCEVSVLGNGRVEPDGGVPKELHQSVRNVVSEAL